MHRHHRDESGLPRHTAVGGAPTIVTGTQTAAGNYQDEDIAISYFHPFIAVAAGSVLTLALCHNGTLEGGVRSAGLSIKGEF